MSGNDIVENNEVIDFYTDEEAVEEMEDSREDSGEERQLKYFNPLDTINGDFDCLSSKGVF